MRDMNKGELILLLATLLLFLVWIGIAWYYVERYPEPKVIEDPVEVVEDTVDTWEQMVLALIQVESEGNDLAYNKTSGATGCLQITDIYVQEVNRLLNEERYTMDDAYDREKSLEMFEVYQGAKNPDKDIRKAIQLHNPGAGEWYTTRVINAMN